MVTRSEQQLKEDAIAIWQAGLEAVRSDKLVEDFIEWSPEGLCVGDDFFEFEPQSRLLVIGAGKAGAGMAAGFEKSLGDEGLKQWNVSGWLNVPEDCVKELSAIHLHAARPAGVNEPRAEGVFGTEEILKRIDELSERDLCVCLISGGGSALLPCPIAGVSLEDKQAVTRFLSRRGANIVELNTVRKALSQVKGGGLARRCRATMVVLVISDVLGDPLEVIASGPTIDQPRPVKAALEILHRFDPDRASIPDSVFHALDMLLSEEETLNRHAKEQTTRLPATGNEPPRWNVIHHIVGNNAIAVDAAGVEAERRGYSHAMNCSRKPEGDVVELAQHHADMAWRMRNQRGPDCLITGGEPTVSLTPDATGKGGRNQHLILAALLHLLEQDPSGANPAAGICMLSGGTDGEDGPTDAAGAWLGTEMVKRLEELFPDPKQRQQQLHGYAERFDAYALFSQAKSLLQTGPTHTNVCDLRVIVVDRIEPQQRASPCPSEPSVSP